MTYIGSVIILCVIGFIIFWGLGECAREPWDREFKDKPETPQYKVYVKVMKKLCNNTTIFGKIVIGTLVSIFLIPSVIIIPVMHFIRDVFKAAMFK